MPFATTPDTPLCRSRWEKRLAQQSPKMESGAKNVVQVPADVDISDLPANIKAGEVFYVGSLPYICEENDCPGLLVADRGEDGLTTVPENVGKFLVIRQLLQ